MKPTIDMTLLDSVEYLAERGFHAKTIGEITGLSRAQVYYRTGRMNISLKSYRDGKSEAAKEFIKVTPCVKISVKAEKGQTYKVAGLRK